MNTNRNNTLKLRARSIRNLTAAELRVANGGATCGSVASACSGVTIRAR
jgi:hypothetical protein